MRPQNYFEELSIVSPEFTTGYFKVIMVVVIHYLILESIAVANKPTPIPAIKLPMKYKAD